MSDLLAAMVAAARRSADERERAGRAAVEAEAARREPRAGAFRASLEAPGVRVIAECKRRSPSRGVLRRAYDPAAIAGGYARAGAAAISVLTEPAFFDGSLDHLRAVRAAVALPVLGKDFIVTPFQVVEARAAGADAVLLIAAALEARALGALAAEAAAQGLAALVEVHDEGEVDRARAAGAAIVGVNARDLRTLEVDLARLEALRPRLPDGAVAVAESGMRSGADLARMRDLGYHACLVGERLMTEPDPGAALARWLDEARAPEGAAP